MKKIGFLSLQRQKGRIGCTQGIYMELSGIEKRRAKREKRAIIIKQSFITEPGKLIIINIKINSKKILL